MASENLHAFLRFWAKRWPDRIALWCDGKTITWAELDRASDEIAAGLARAGVKKGDAVGILMSNRLEFAHVMFGVFKAGAMLTLLNVRFTAREMVYPIQDARIRVVVTEK